MGERRCFLCAFCDRINHAGIGTGEVRYGCRYDRYSEKGYGGLYIDVDDGRAMNCANYNEVKMTKPKNETPKEAEVPQTPAEPNNETPKTHGPRDYLVKAAELLKEHGESRNISVAQNAIEEALMFIGKEGL